MKIDVSKISGYAEMSAEEKVKALEAFESEEKQTKDSDEVIKLKEALNKATSEAAQNKRLLREKQTEQERAEAERKEAEEKLAAELQSLRKEKSVSEYTANFVGLGFDTELAKKSASALADGDITTIFDNIKTFKDGFEKSLKADALRSTPAPVSGSVDKGQTTKQEFDSMTYRQRVEFKQTNPDLYQEYTK